MQLSQSNLPPSQPPSSQFPNATVTIGQLIDVLSTFNVQIVFPSPEQTMGDIAPPLTGAVLSTIGIAMSSLGLHKLEAPAGQEADPLFKDLDSDDDDVFKSAPNTPPKKAVPAQADVPPPPATLKLDEKNNLTLSYMTETKAGGYQCGKCGSYNKVMSPGDLWYCVVVGKRAGVVKGWHLASSFVSGYPGAVHHKAFTEKEALYAFYEAFNNGCVKSKGGYVGFHVGPSVN